MSLPPVSPTPAALKFQNRESELQAVLDSLAGPESARLFLLVAMPTMGKSMFLRQLQLELTGRQLPPHAIWTIDLEHAPQEARTQLPMFLRELYPSSKWLDPSQYHQELAAKVLESGLSCLMVIDNLHLLAPHVTLQLREILGKAFRAYPTLPLTLVATSRVRIPEVMPPRPPANFRVMHLNHFDDHSIYNAVRESGDGSWPHLEVRNFVREGTEGIPALLTPSLQWLRTHYPDGQSSLNAQQGRHFSDVVKPFIENALLSPTALLPLNLSPRSQQQLDRVHQSFATLALSTSIFRLLTRSHLKLIESEQNYSPLRSALAELRAYGSPFDLYSAMPVVEPKLRNWCATYPCARRLYFRYHHLSPESQSQAHNIADNLYRNWTGDMSLADNAQFHLERFWHVSELIRVTSSNDAPAQLLRRFDALLADVRTWRKFLPMFKSDRELQWSVESIKEGLYADVLTLLPSV